MTVKSADYQQFTFCQYPQMMPSPHIKEFFGGVVAVVHLQYVTKS